MKNVIKAILFDMDGVIVDSMFHHMTTWKAVFGEEGIFLDETEIYKREGMSGSESLEDIFFKYGKPKPTENKLESMVLQKQELFEKYTVEVFPHVETILNSIKSKNIKTALVTGSARRTVKKLISPLMNDLFDTVVTSEDVTKGKPHPEPYLLASQKLDCKTCNCIVVENSPMGIESAKNAKMKCYAVMTTLDESFLRGADFVFESHMALYRHFEDELGAF